MLEGLEFFDVGFFYRDSLGCVGLFVFGSGISDCVKICV